MKNKNILKPNLTDFTLHCLQRLSSKQGQHYAEIICNKIAEESKGSSMIALKPEGLLNKGRTLVLIDGCGELVSTLSIDAIVFNKRGQSTGEIGAMYTDPRYRRKGYASFLLDRIEKWSYQNDYELLYAFANNVSMILFEDKGYKFSKSKAKQILPAAAFDLCKTSCPNYDEANDTCCDNQGIKQIS